MKTSLKYISSNIFKKGNDTNINVGNKSNVPFFTGGILPPTLLEESNVPKFYIEAIKSCGAYSKNQNPNVVQVYNLMLTSQLPIEILKEILYFVNKVTPEKLTRQEFYSCLALIALAQKKQTISDLSSATQLPIPFLQTYQAVTSMGSIEMENKNIKDHILRKPKTNDSNIININMPFFNNSHSSSSNNLSNNILINKEHYENIILYNWIKIIDKSVDIIDNANCILTKSISLSSDVSRTKKGIMFIASLYAIHQVVKRIAASVNILGENGSKLLSKIQTFGEIWANLLELTFFNEAIEKNTSDQRKYDFKKENINCCLCLRSITSCIISFNNFSYHNECGNFWINFISSPLPNHYIQM